MVRIASRDWLITCGASWLCSNTSPAATTNSALTSAATVPRPATASRRAAEYRGWASLERKCRVIPSCQSAVCTNRIPIPSSPSDHRPGSVGHRECMVGHRQIRGPSSAGPDGRSPRGDRMPHPPHPHRKTGDQMESRNIGLPYRGCPTVDRMSDKHRTLVLLRHAKSAYPTGVADHDRPLTPRGMREAGLAGDWLRSNLPGIDAVLCSTATRARQTLVRTGIDVRVRYVDRLYEATPGAVLDEINTITDDVATLLLVGHEPTMSQVALGLAGIRGTDPRTEARIATKFPTSGIAVLRVEGGWRGLGLGGAALIDFHVPR